MRMCAAIAAVVLGFLVVPVVARAQTEKTAEEKRTFSEEADALEKEFDFLESELAGDMAAAEDGAEEGNGDGAEEGNGDEPTAWHGITTWKGSIREIASYKLDYEDGSGYTREDASVSASVTLKVDDIRGEDRILFWGATGLPISVHRDYRLHAYQNHCYKHEATASATTADGNVRLAIDLDEGTYNIHYDAGTAMEEYYYQDICLPPPAPQTKERWTDTNDVPGIIHLGGTFEDITLPSSMGPLTGSQDNSMLLPSKPAGPSGTRTFTWNLRPGCGKEDLPRIVIEEPWETDQLVFEETRPEELNRFAAAVVTPKASERDLRWTFPEIAGSKLKTEPDDRRGKIVKFTYEKMPEENTEFGDREIKVVSTLYEECMEPVSRQVSFFFERDGSGNPSGEVPNWFYYWLQTKAGQGLDGKGVVAYVKAEICRDEDDPANKVYGYFSYVPDLSDAIFICDDAKLEKSNAVTGRLTEGIDTFATTVIHELEHKKNYDRWWKDFYAAFYGLPGFEEKIRRVDQDNDYIPDDEERALGFNPRKRSTHNNRLSDEHYLVYKAQSRWRIGSANKEDWAQPGKQ